MIQIQQNTKAACYAASTEHVDIQRLTACREHLVLDEIRVPPNRRVLLRMQNDARENGIYWWDGKRLDRAEDAATFDQLEGAFVAIEHGVQYGQSLAGDRRAFAMVSVRDESGDGNFAWVEIARADGSPMYFRPARPARCTHLSSGVPTARWATTVSHVSNPEVSQSELNTTTLLCAVCSEHVVRLLRIIERADEGAVSNTLGRGEEK